MKKLKTDRIDVNHSIKSMSHNIPDHEERMLEHIRKAEQESLNKRKK